jgi:hypothetical protein
VPALLQVAKHQLQIRFPETRAFAQCVGVVVGLFE